MNDLKGIDLITSDVINAAITVHKELGPGLLESVYQKCMVIQLEALGLRVESEVSVPIVFKGQKIHDDGFRVDLSGSWARTPRSGNIYHGVGTSSDP